MKNFKCGCGENNPVMFYVSRKSKCKKCLSIDYQNRENKKNYIEKQKIWANNNLIKFRVLAAKHRAIG